MSEAVQLKCERAGADGYRSHTLHVQPDGAFSIVGLVWRPGQLTRIPDHMTWCVFGVIQGLEHEELFEGGRSTTEVQRAGLGELRAWRWW